MILVSLRFILCPIKHLTYFTFLIYLHPSYRGGVPSLMFEGEEILPVEMQSKPNLI
jgi:hypothetical protein